MEPVNITITEEPIKFTITEDATDEFGEIPSTNERKRRYTFPSYRMSYDRNDYNEQMFRRAYPSVNAEDGIFGQPYTGLSSPNLPPVKLDINDGEKSSLFLGISHFEFNRNKDTRSRSVNTKIKATSTPQDTTSITDDFFKRQSM
ncbi:16389_t:CDS:1 [Acaulospora colombiana]|uniref:16389_t:CDS:1 n=1 Tax=Acaulospora colombiana TaxID=27376 RepID=A0ACA9LGV9_9GLOM|nr:16389_t:CDS:1 [Acaulospora colombiana]